MTPEEMSTWHGKLRDHRNFQTMQAHLASVSIKTEKKTSKKPVDMSDFV
jgi:hypothetical protein